MAEMLKTKMVAIFGTGKSFRQGETSILEEGTEIGRRFDKDGWHFFSAKEFGRYVLYAVKTALMLDAALDIEAPKERPEVQAVRLALLTLTQEERTILAKEFGYQL